MARPNKAEVARKRKEAKQRKLLFLLLPIFLGLVVWQGPKMLKAFQGPAQAAPPPATTTASTDPAAAPQASTTPSAAAAELPDTDGVPVAAADQLISFSRFTGRDPFERPSGSSPSGESADAASGTDGSDGAQALSSAVIEVNGTSETVLVNGGFPAGDPTFTLVSLTSEKAVVGLVSGSFEGGQSTIELTVGRELELAADPDGTRYTLKLVSVG